MVAADKESSSGHPNDGPSGVALSSGTGGALHRAGIAVGLHDSGGLYRSLPVLIIVRAILVFGALNLAYPLRILPDRLGTIPFLPLFNTLTILLMLAYFALWSSGRHLMFQLYAQIVLDLVVTTVLVANTRGIESPFVSFYILIIIYSSLLLGRIGGVAGAALSTSLYAGMIVTDYLGLTSNGTSPMDPQVATFRISAHCLGFFSVAFLGAYLSRRLRDVQIELEEKINSLKQLQHLNELIVSSIRSGLVTTDLKGRIAVFNNTAEELTGREGSRMLESPIQGLVGDELWASIVRNDFFKDARPMRHEEWVTLQAGTRRYLGFSVSPLLDHAQKMLGYIFSFQDLTEIKRLEEEVRLKDRMAAIGRMAAGLAHEIRNPLTSMRGSVEILRSRVSLPKKDERLLDILIRESDRLNKFVEDFLLFARPERRAKSPVELSQFLRDSVTLLKNNPEVRDKYDVRLDLDPQRIHVMGNADQLEQVFWNLAQNAVRAMPGGGTLTIASRLLTDGGSQITFEDAGVGMTPEEIEKLFQPFHSTFEGGTGLGLSIIFQIMEDHRGKISFDSEKGKGTKVTLYFPPLNQVVCSNSAGEAVCRAS